ncbi:MAG: Mce-associated rane protein [Mycobacterium sp.]|nr:Mce-associated rane protein [Mycobacterium sp.]
MTDPDGPAAEGSISVAEADDEVARAEARAEAARARVARLRRAAETEDAKDDGAVPEADDRRPTKSFRSRLRWPHRPRRKAVAVGVGIVLGCASLGASGYMVWQHHTLMHKRQLAREYAAAARQGVTTLMSFDANHVKEDFQRIIDASTGELKDQLSATASFRAKQAEDAKASSKVAVEAVAVESVSDNSAVVLVSAKSDVTDVDNTKRPPALWQISITIDRVDGQLKMSRVDFLQ